MQEELSGISKRLVDEGLLTVEDALFHQRSAKDAKQDGLQYLIENSVILESDMAQFLAKLAGIKYFDLTKDFEEHSRPTGFDENIVSKHKLLPISMMNNKLVVAVAALQSMEHGNSLKLSAQYKNLKIEYVMVEYSKLIECIDRLYGQYDHLNSVDYDALVNSMMSDNTQIEEVSQQEAHTVAADQDSQPVIFFVNKLLAQAVYDRASDLHFEPFEKYFRIRFRVDGILKLVHTTPISLAMRIVSRLKILAGMDISEKRSPQDGRIRIKLGERGIDLRANSLPTVYGEKIVLRILDASSAKLGIDALGYEPEQKEMFLEALHRPQGMILITGPTGSGKTVSLYTGLNILNQMDTNISTAEDPVEINLDGVNQCGVNVRTGMTFAAMLRSLLRQDPDVIMVGEIRDLETAEIAIKAAQTGHMVMSTLHTNSAPETLTRLGNMGVPSFNIATSVNLVIAQRLARRLCSNCKEVAEYPVNVLKEAGFTDEEIAEGVTIYKHVGCEQCSNDGYRGRIGVYEVMKITPEISRLIMEGANSLQLAEAAERAGFASLRQSGLKKVKAGLTTIQEVVRITTE